MVILAILLIFVGVVIVYAAPRRPFDLIGMVVAVIGLILLIVWLFDYLDVKT